MLFKQHASRREMDREHSGTLFLLISADLSKLKNLLLAAFCWVIACFVSSLHFKTPEQHRSALVPAVESNIFQYWPLQSIKHTCNNNSHASIMQSAQKSLPSVTNSDCGPLLGPVL